MYKHPLYFLLCCFFLSSCDDGGKAVQPESITAKPLDLTVTSEMLEKYVSQDPEMEWVANSKDRLFDTQARSSEPESPVKVRGELFYDEARGNNLDAINGGAIQLEFRFN